jgi:class 3 adenylate cyclase
LEGKKVMAIYGFCDIRNFTNATEVLKETIMVFVNEIAEIVHEIADQYCGSANKNAGDAFLLVWKFDDEFVERTVNDLRIKPCLQVNQMTDMALIAFIQILMKVQVSKKLDKVR